MIAWPTNLTVKPLISWPGPFTPDRERRSSPFRAGLSQTYDELARELDQLRATNRLLQVAIPAHRFGVKGRPFADAIPEHPGVILTMDSHQGALSYPCDTFTRWQDNLRAITLALEALRKVNRYGVTKNGEQYRGFLALEATATPMLSSRGQAEAIIREAAGFKADEPVTARIVRAAKFQTHPDTRMPEIPAFEYERVVAAEQLLKELGLL